jgi:predicted transcriptional regulator
VTTATIVRSAETDELIDQFDNMSRSGHIEPMQLLRLSRIVFGIPGSVLAAKAGVSAREVARIERGDVRPKADTLLALDGALVALVRARVREEVP